MAESAENKPFFIGKTKCQLREFLAGPFALVGRGVIRWLGNLGAVAIFFVLSLTMVLRPKQLLKIVHQV